MTEGASSVGHCLVRLYLLALNKLFPMQSQTTQSSPQLSLLFFFPYNFQLQPHTFDKQISKHNTNRSRCLPRLRFLLLHSHFKSLLLSLISVCFLVSLFPAAVRWGWSPSFCQDSLPKSFQSHKADKRTQTTKE